MGYYRAWGDMKMMCSSEEEGYENRVLEAREKRRGYASSTFGEPSVPILSISIDDTDQQFWAEDELSNSESRQRLTSRRKRRHSISYRNRRNRSRSYIHVPHSLNSSSDSTCAKTSLQIHRKRRCQCQCQLKKLQFMNSEEASGTSIKGTTINKVVFPECQIASTSGQKSTNSYPDNHQAGLSSINHREQTDDTIRRVRKIRLKKIRDSPKY
nr:PREDICTED: uncharacterized protein LOC105671113 [Linepithema humile]